MKWHRDVILKQLILKLESQSVKLQVEGGTSFRGLLFVIKKFNKNYPVRENTASS